MHKKTTQNDRKSKPPEFLRRVSVTCSRILCMWYLQQKSDNVNTSEPSQSRSKEHKSRDKERQMKVMTDDLLTSTFGQVSEIRWCCLITVACSALFWLTFLAWLYWLHNNPLAIYAYLQFVIHWWPLLGHASFYFFVVTNYFIFNIPPAKSLVFFHSHKKLIFAFVHILYIYLF